MAEPAHGTRRYYQVAHCACEPCRAANTAYSARYREAWRAVWIDGDPARRVRALCYVVDRGHRQYAGRLSVARQLHFVRQGHGRSGPNREYVLDAVKAIEALGYYQTELHVLAEKLKGPHEAHGSR